MTSKPYEIMQWDAPEAPTQERLIRMMNREMLFPDEMTISPGKTAEMQYNQPLVYVLVSGALYVGFPGYGSVDLTPGDVLEIHLNTTHDITVTSPKPAKLLKALR